MPGTTLILHPDPSTHDLFGLLTVPRVRQYTRWLEAWIAGYNTARWRTRGGSYRTSPSLWAADTVDYADARDALLVLTDMPYETACQVALWVTRDPATMYYLSFPVVL